MNKDQAVDNLMVKFKIESLRDVIYNCYKDQYQACGYHILGYDKPALVSWLLYHYDWDENLQKWISKNPLDYDSDPVIETVH